MTSVRSGRRVAFELDWSTLLMDRARARDRAASASSTTARTEKKTIAKKTSANARMGHVIASHLRTSDDRCDARRYVESREEAAPNGPNERHFWSVTRQSPSETKTSQSRSPRSGGERRTRGTTCNISSHLFPSSSSPHLLSLLRCVCRVRACALRCAE